MSGCKEVKVKSPLPLSPTTPVLKANLLYSFFLWPQKEGKVASLSEAPEALLWNFILRSVHPNWIILIQFHIFKEDFLESFTPTEDWVKVLFSYRGGHLRLFPHPPFLFYFWEEADLS